MSKILLVEDDLSVAMPFVAWLESENYTVDLATTGEDAIQLLAISSFDVVILDWELPCINGFQVLETLRYSKQSPQVIFLTGRQDLNSKLDALDGGADDYLVKPCNPRELSARVRSMLRRPWRSMTNEILAHGDLTLHPETGEFFIKDKAIRLTSKEFSIIEFLLRHQNQVFNAKDLLKEVWSSDTESTEGAVRQAMVRLRRKLSAYGVDNFIKTAAETGYLVDSETK